MAKFTQNEELRRQARRVAMDKVSGGREIGLKLLGYKDTGEMNTWGKVLSAATPTGTLRNVAARGLAGDTDTRDVLKEGTDNAMATDMSFLKFAGDVAALGAGGAGGAGGASQATGVANGGTGTGGGMLGKMFGKLKEGGLKGLFGGDMTEDDITPDAEGANTDVDNTNADVQRTQWKQNKEKEGYTFSGGKMFDPQGKEVGTEEDVYKKEVGGANNPVVDNNAQSDSSQGGGGGVLKKMGQLGDNLGALGSSPVVGSGMQLASNVIGAVDEAEEEAKKFQGQSRMSNFSYL